MNSKLLACLLYLLAGKVLAQTMDATPQSFRPEINIPAVISKFKKPGSVNGPEITVEEIEKCMKQDVGMQADLDEFKKSKAQIESSRAALINFNEVLAAARKALDANQISLQQKINKYNEEGSALGQDALQIEAKKKSKPKSQAEVNKINAFIGTYNANVAKHNKARVEITQEQGDFNAEITKHNESVLKANQSVVEFNEKNGALEKTMQALLEKFGKFNLDCTGEKVLKK